MAKALSIDQLKKLAAHGARARLEELRAEIAAISRTFPDVGAGAGDGPARGRRGRRPQASASDGGAAGSADGPRRRRRRGKLSAAGRAAISAAQKKRWAAIKKKKASSPPKA